jgi:membrane protease YdiL (CAAX protease family)
MRFLVDPATVTMGAVAWVFLVVICVLLPLSALRMHRRLAAGTLQITRTRIYVSAIGTHATFLLMVWAVTRTERLNLLPPYHFRPLHVVIGLIALAIGLVPVLERFNLSDAIARERTRLIAPRASREFGVFYLLSITAGVAEELTYRGLLFTLLAALVIGWLPATGAWTFAAVISSLVFGIVHMFQGWKSAGVAALMGLREQLVVGLTGTLVVAIVVHALHDVVAGTVIGLRARSETAATGGSENK